MGLANQAAAVEGMQVSGMQCLETRMVCMLPLPQVLLRDVTEAEGAARVFSRWEEVVEGSAGAHPPLSARLRASARPVAAWSHSIASGLHCKLAVSRQKC